MRAPPPPPPLRAVLPLLLGPTRAAGCTAEDGVDYYGGDLQPLGAGFRNATSPADCCAQCEAAAAAGCAYYSYSPSSSRAAAAGPPKPKHNCWLKSALQKRKKNGARVSGSTGEPAPPTPPPPPAPLPASPCAGVDVATHPWCDASLPARARARAAVAAMTLDEKAQQVSTYTPKVQPGIARLGWPPYGYHSEGLHGLRDSKSAAGLPTTVFPQTTAMAAAGNLSLVAEMGRVMAREARAVNSEMLRQGKGPIAKGGSLFFWSPTMNLGRDPRWGRFQESISEDPFMLGAYSAAFLRAFQAEDTTGYPATISSCKHFVAYSLEGGGKGPTGDHGFSRHNFDAVVSSQDLSESYLPPFHQCVTQGKPAQVMCSYNALNGVPTCARADLLNDTLRSMWGFDGFVVSDQGAVRDISTGHNYAPNETAGVADALNAGCDVNDGAQYANNVPAAVAAGLLSEARVDEALERLLTQRFRAGSFDDPAGVAWTRTPPSVCDSAPHRAVALQAARESVVLLNNSAPDPAHRLPWPPASVRNLAVVGAYASRTDVLSGGKTDYQTTRYYSILDGLRGAYANVTYSSGLDAASVAQLVAAASTDAVVVVVGIDIESGGKEGSDRSDIGLPADQLKVARSAVEAAGGQKRVAVVLLNGNPLSCDWCRDSVDTLVDAFYGGEFAGNGTADVISGAVNPSGVMPFSVFPSAYVDAVNMTDMSMRTTSGVGRTYRFYDPTTPLGPPLWAFGYGLSYTTFTVQWKDAVLRGAAGTPGVSLCAGCGGLPGRFEATALVTNTGGAAGAKVVMAYVAELTPRGVLHRRVAAAAGAPARRAPHKSLFAYTKVFLAPGESASVPLSAPLLPGRDEWCAFCSVADTGARVVAPGRYAVTVGGDGRPTPAHRFGGGGRADAGDEARVDVDLRTAAGAPVAAPLHAMRL